MLNVDDPARRWPRPRAPRRSVLRFGRSRARRRPRRSPSRPDSDRPLPASRLHRARAASRRGDASPGLGDHHRPQRPRRRGRGPRRRRPACPSRWSHRARPPTRADRRPTGRRSRCRDGGLLIDDTYNANPQSMEVALRTLARDESKGQLHRGARRHGRTRRVRRPRRTRATGDPGREASESTRLFAVGEHATRRCCPTLRATAGMDAAHGPRERATGRRRRNASSPGTLRRRRPHPRQGLAIDAHGAHRRATAQCDRRRRELTRCSTTCSIPLSLRDTASFNVFRYITFRTGAATLTALFIAFAWWARR